MTGGTEKGDIINKKLESISKKWKADVLRIIFT